MTTEQAMQLSEDALTRLMDALNAGHSDALRAYLKLMSRFHRYSWGNCLLIATQYPNATFVAGFRAWLKLGRSVRKGEKGLVILAPMVRCKTKEAETPEPERERLVGFRPAYVFDIKQTDGEPLPTFASVDGDPGPNLDRLKAFATSKDIHLEYSESIAPADGVSSGGTVTLLPNMPSAKEFAVLVHEVAHELLHRGDRRRETTHVVRETEAEAVAFVVCQAIGLDTNTASRDYIHLHSGERDTLKESLSVVQRTASEILEAIGLENQCRELGDPCRPVSGPCHGRAQYRVLCGELLHPMPVRRVRSAFDGYCYCRAFRFDLPVLAKEGKGWLCQGVVLIRRCQQPRKRSFHWSGQQAERVF